MRLKAKVKKSRYFCVSVNGEEIYSERMSLEGRLSEHLMAARIRLREIERVMPLGLWSARVEEQWPEGGARHYQWFDVKTGKLEERVMA